jgi:omega-6 fatty acid desaturase (delta-12 desaturase)
MHPTHDRCDRSLYEAARAYQHSSTPRSLWQIANSVIPYLGLLVAMYWSLGVSVWLTFALAVPAASFLARIFIIFHDCGHGSFFRWRRANDVLGFFAGLLFFLPFHYWTNHHAVHHATTGNLGRRGTGDIYTMTVQEYRNLPPRSRLLYRMYRHPASLLVVGPLFTFFVRYRYWYPSDGWRRRRSAMRTNGILLAAAAAAVFLPPVRTLLFLHMPTMLLAGTVGVWLFYVQHQFERTYWARGGNWDHLQGAVQGSSFYKLPRLLQWITGNIGFHHVHHLNPLIPNYNLEACHEAVGELRNVAPLTMRTSLHSMRCNLWDERLGRMVSFAEATG